MDLVHLINEQYECGGNRYLGMGGVGKKCGVVLTKAPYMQVLNSQTIKKYNKLDAPSFSRWELVLVIALKLDTLVWSPSCTGHWFSWIGSLSWATFFLGVKAPSVLLCAQSKESGWFGRDWFTCRRSSTRSQLVTSDSYLLTSASASNGRWVRSHWWSASCRLLVHRLESRHCL